MVCLETGSLAARTHAVHGSFVVVGLRSGSGWCNLRESESCFIFFARVGAG